MLSPIYDDDYVASFFSAFSLSPIGFTILTIVLLLVTLFVRFNSNDEELDAHSLLVLSDEF